MGSPSLLQSSRAKQKRGGGGANSASSMMVAHDDGGPGGTRTIGSSISAGDMMVTEGEGGYQPVVVICVGLIRGRYFREASQSLKGSSDVVTCGGGPPQQTRDEGFGA